MNSLNLPNPKMMDVAVPANKHQGMAQEQIAKRGWAYSAEQASALLDRPDITLIDLREKRERERHGALPGALHLPYPDLQASIGPGGMLHELAKSANRTIVFYCAFGERSGNGGAGIAGRRHPDGAPHPGRIDAWKKSGGPPA